jgi:hypothetical protein
MPGPASCPSHAPQRLKFRNDIPHLGYHTPQEATDAEYRFCDQVVGTHPCLQAHPLPSIFVDRMISDIRRVSTMLLVARHVCSDLSIFILRQSLLCSYICGGMELHTLQKYSITALPKSDRTLQASLPKVVLIDVIAIHSNVFGSATPPVALSHRLFTTCHHTSI